MKVYKQNSDEMLNSSLRTLISLVRSDLCCLHSCSTRIKISDTIIKV